MAPLPPERSNDVSERRQGEVDGLALVHGEPGRAGLEQPLAAAEVDEPELADSSCSSSSSMPPPSPYGDPRQAVRPAGGVVDVRPGRRPGSPPSAVPLAGVLEVRRRDVRQPLHFHGATFRCQYAEATTTDQVHERRRWDMENLIPVLGIFQWIYCWSGEVFAGELN